MDEIDVSRLIGGKPRIEIDDIVGHPRLPLARKLYLKRFLEVYGGDPFLVRLLIEAGRFLMFLNTIVLDASQDPARRETWLTVGLLKRSMACNGLASGRHIDELVARLCAVGYMRMVPSDRDRRVRILQPTEKLRAHDRDWLFAHYTPLTVLYPEHDYGAVMRRDPDFQLVFRSICAPFLTVGAQLLLSVPDMMLFFERAAGYMVLATLLDAAMAEPDQLQVPVPYADVGDRFGVSRTHVRKLLAAAEAAGLVKLHARGGHRVEILPRLWASHDRGIAGGMYLHDMAYVVAAKQALTSPAGGERSDRVGDAGERLHPLVENPAS